MTLQELRSYVAQEGRKVIVIGPNVYGIARNGKEAHRLAGKPRQWIAFDCHGKTIVSHFDGSLSLASEDNPEQSPAEECFREIGRNVKK